MSSSTIKYVVIGLLIVGALVIGVLLVLDVRIALMPSSTPTPAQPDSDGDSVPDYRDSCPTECGLAQFDGCPNAPPPGIITPVPASNGDGDADGIPDGTDVCPDQFGIAEKNGCP